MPTNSFVPDPAGITNLPNIPIKPSISAQTGPPRVDAFSFCIPYLLHPLSILFELDCNFLCKLDKLANLILKVRKLLMPQKVLRK